MKNLILLILYYFFQVVQQIKKDKKDAKIEEKTITQLDIKEFKEEQEKVIDLTASEGPESGVVNIKKTKKSFNQKRRKIK